MPASAPFSSPAPSAPAPFRTVDELLHVLDDPVVGDDVVAALAHHLQCAALLAEDAPGDVELQVAGLVHDVASSMDPRPAGDHAAIGAELVRGLFGDRVADLVGGHVDAKRYLVTVDPGYRAVLSEGSTATLALQGEQLTPAEFDAFERAPLRDDWVALRRADDRAKVPGAAVPGLDRWRAVLDGLASR
jgi:predicted HD phosphohydrolase